VSASEPTQLNPLLYGL